MELQSIDWTWHVCRYICWSKIYSISGCQNIPQLTDVIGASTLPSPSSRPSDGWRTQKSFHSHTELQFLFNTILRTKTEKKKSVSMLEITWHAFYFPFIINLYLLPLSLCISLPFTFIFQYSVCVARWFSFFISAFAQKSAFYFNERLLRFLFMKNMYISHIK